LGRRGTPHLADTAATLIPGRTPPTPSRVTRAGVRSPAPAAPAAANVDASTSTALIQKIVGAIGHARFAADAGLAGVRMLRSRQIVTRRKVVGLSGGYGGGNRTARRTPARDHFRVSERNPGRRGYGQSSSRRILRRVQVPPSWKCQMMARATGGVECDAAQHASRSSRTTGCSKSMSWFPGSS
jgi:hypothetical protein